MFKRVFFVLAVLAFLAAGNGWVTAAGGPEYKAVYVVTQGKEVATQTLYVKGSAKMRLEMDARTGAVQTIVRLDKNVVWVLMTGEKMYMEQKFNPKQWAQYQNDQDFFKEKAKKIGEEKVLGYNCAIYEYVDGNITTKHWVVKDLWINLRIIMLESGKEKLKMEAKELKVGPQADALFEVPNGYEKIELNFNLPGMGSQG
ncbi:MAG TPA: DUF4412 domain-containing protein [Bacillota bacterium]|nr:DUF4412 domain-containing protein [Bacillota bacterium]